MINEWTSSILQVHLCKIVGTRLKCVASWAPENQRKQLIVDRFSFRNVYCQYHTYSMKRLSVLADAIFPSHDIFRVFKATKIRLRLSSSVHQKYLKNKGKYIYA